MKKLFFVFMLSLLLVGMAWGQTIVAKWDFEDAAKRTLITNNNSWLANPYTADDGIPLNKDVAKISLAGSPVFAGWVAGPSTGTNAPNSNTWNSQSTVNFWQIEISTVGYENLKVSSWQRGSNTGPRDYKIQYSLDGTNWNDVAGGIITVANDATTGVVSDLPLPVACDNQAIVYLRWLQSSNVAINNAAVAAGGTNRIDDITLSGTPGGSGGGNIAPAISNLITIPSENITSSTPVYVSATITDVDGTVAAADLYWGLVSGNLTNSIPMNIDTGNTWITDYPIPAQADGTTVYYFVYAIDDETDDTQSAEYSYTVQDPQPVLSVDTGSLSKFNYILGNGPSAAKSFNVSGTLLYEDVIVMAPDHYEISLLSDADFTDIIELYIVGDELAETTIYVRLIAGLPVAEYNDEGIIINSSGVDENVICNGYVRPLPPAGYFVDFENESKTGYASGELLLNGLEWNMTNVMISSGKDADWQIDEYSARLRGYGDSSMTMLEDKVDGAGCLSFSYRRYGTENQVDWKVEYSVDQGASWAQLGQDFTALGSNEVQEFKAAINTELPVRIRIKRATETGTAYRRLNIDNILLADYDLCSVQIPNLVPTQIADGLVITIQGGDGEIISGTIPPFSNAAFVPRYGFMLNLLGPGPWNMGWATNAPWGAYYRNGSWTAVENDGSGIYFMGISAAKDLGLPVIFGDVDPTLPVELSSFTVSLNSMNQAVLAWISQSESNLRGYYVYRNETEDLAAAQKLSHLIEATNSSTETRYNYTDTEIYSNGDYYYWLEISELDGSSAYYGPIALVYTDADEGETPSITPHTRLKQVYPNPFNPNANIAFYLAEPAPVQVQVFNSRGQLVRSFELGHKEAGDHRLSWNGTDDKGISQATGVYFFRLNAGKKSYQTKAVLMK